MRSGEHEEEEQMERGGGCHVLKPGTGLNT